MSPFHDQEKEQIHPHYENPNHVVDKLGKHYHISIRYGAVRSFLEAIDYVNLKGRPSYEYGYLSLSGQRHER